MNMRTTFLRAAMLATLAAVAVEAPAQERAKEQPEATTRSLIEQLGDRDFEQRETAEKQLLERGNAAREDLERAAKDHGDPEVRWRAQRILRRLKRGEVKEPADRATHRFDRVEDVDRLFDDIFRRLDKELDIDMGDIRRHLEKARSEARDKARDLDVQAERQSRSMKMSVTPEGVRVEIEEADRDGKVDKKTYEAEDMESFKRKYPEVAKRFGIGGSGLLTLRGNFPRLDLDDFGLRRWTWPDQDLHRRLQEQMKDYEQRRRELMEQWRRLQPPVARLFEFDNRRQNETPEIEMPPPGERLGIYASDAPADVAEFLGLEAGQGLRVEEVVKGSLAETLGIQKGDILFQVADVKIFAVVDVRKALRKTKVGETVRVHVNRRGRVLALEAKKPDIAEDEKELKDEKEDARESKKLKQRGKLR